MRDWLRRFTAGETVHCWRCDTQTPLHPVRGLGHDLRCWGPITAFWNFICPLDARYRTHDTLYRG